MTVSDVAAPGAGLGRPPEARMRQTEIPSLLVVALCAAVAAPMLAALAYLALLAPSPAATAAALGHRHALAREALARFGEFSASLAPERKAGPALAALHASAESLAALVNAGDRDAQPVLAAAESLRSVVWDEPARASGGAVRGRVQTVLQQIEHVERGLDQAYRGQFAAAHTEVERTRTLALCAMGASLAALVAVAAWLMGRPEKARAAPVRNTPFGPDALDVSPPDSPLASALWNELQRRSAAPPATPWAPPPVATLATSRGVQAVWPLRSVTPAVLIESPDAEVRRRLQGMLARAGCDVEATPVPADTTAAFARRRFDLVLVDAEASLADAEACARGIREDEARCFAFPPVPVVALVRDADTLPGSGDVPASGLSAFETLPAEHHQLEAVLDRWLPARLRPAPNRQVQKAASW